MGAAAEVLEGAVAVERDGLDAFVGDQVFDQLDLVALVLGLEDLDRLGDRDVAARELLLGGDVGAHRLLDRLQVGLGDLDLGRELEVVVEAVLDRRADRHLGPGVELLHRLGHHVGGVVADQVERLGVAVGEDPDLGAVGERRGEVAQLAVDADRQRRLGEARPDRRRRVGPGRPLGQLQRLAVGQRDGDLRAGLHGRPCYPRAATPHMPAQLLPSGELTTPPVWKSRHSELLRRGLARLADGDQGAVALAARRVRRFPERVGAGAPAQAQAGGRATGRDADCAGAFGDDEADPGGGPTRLASSAASMQTRPPRSSQAM